MILWTTRTLMRSPPVPCPKCEVKPLRAVIDAGRAWCSVCRERIEHYPAFGRIEMERVGPWRWDLVSELTEQGTTPDGMPLWSLSAAIHNTVNQVMPAPKQRGRARAMAMRLLGLYRAELDEAMWASAVAWTRTEEGQDRDVFRAAGEAMRKAWEEVRCQ